MSSKNFMLRIACKCKCVALTLSLEPWFWVLCLSSVSGCLGLSQGEFYQTVFSNFRWLQARNGIPTYSLSWAFLKITTQKDKSVTSILLRH